MIVNVARPREPSAAATRDLRPPLLASTLGTPRGDGLGHCSAS